MSTSIICISLRCITSSPPVAAILQNVDLYANRDGVYVYSHRKSIREAYNVYNAQLSTQGSIEHRGIHKITRLPPEEKIEQLFGLKSYRSNQSNNAEGLMPTYGHANLVRSYSEV
jgi:hypothetical protein